MLLLEIKNLINELEEILIKDERFKDCYHFKNQVKIIFKKKYLNNNSTIDITPFITNLVNLNKPQELAPILQESPIDPPIDPPIIPVIFEDNCEELRKEVHKLYKRSDTFN